MRGFLPVDENEEGGAAGASAQHDGSPDVTDRIIPADGDMPSRRIRGWQDAIMDEVMPRLLRANPVSEPVCRHDAHEVVTASRADVSRFVIRLLNGDEDGARLQVTRLLDMGVAHDSLYLDLFQSAARRLGGLWEADTCNFMDVTSAMGGLSQIFRDVSRSRMPPLSMQRDGRRVLLATPPAETHHFGMIMLREFLCLAGWGVTAIPAAPTQALERMVGEGWYLIAGLSVGSNREVGSVKNTIRRIRNASRNRDINIMVGGPCILAQPSLVDEVGADLKADDGRQATVIAESLLYQRVHAGR